MFATLTWTQVFLLAYLSFCLFIAVQSSRKYTDPRHFFSPANGINTWINVLALTSVTFAGWLFSGQLGQLFQSGLSFGGTAFSVILIPLVGTLVLKKQWLLGRQFKFMTSGDMFSAYFKNDVISIVAIGVMLLFAIPFLATLFSASGSLIAGVTDGAISRDAGMWTLSLVVIVYSITGGIDAVVKVAVVQALLFAGALVIIGIYALSAAGGFISFGQGLAKLAATPNELMMTQGLGGGNYNSLFAVSGVIQWTGGLGRDVAVGGIWTAIMGLTTAVTFMGLQIAPHFSVLGFAARSPRAFAIHQVWGSAFCIGVLVFVFLPIISLGAHLLGADAVANSANIAIGNVLPEVSRGQQGVLVQYFIKAIGISYPWLAGLLAVAGIAAFQSAAAAYIVTSGTILAQDVYSKHVEPRADWHRKILISRFSALLVGFIALVMASFTPNAVLVLSALAIPMSLQLLPALFGVLWLPWLTRRAAIFGLFVGLIAVLLTEQLGQMITGNYLPWGRWPWSIHSGVWGLFFNSLVCVGAVIATSTDRDRSHRDTFHSFFEQITEAADHPSRLKSIPWILVLIWTFFGPGPGAVIGNSFFGDPGGGYDAWIFGVPSLWAWQVIWWVLGVGLIWFLAVKMQLSVLSARQLQMATSINKSHTHLDGGYDGR